MNTTINIDPLTRLVQTSLLRLRWFSVAAMVLAAWVSPLLLGPSELQSLLLLYAAMIAVVNLGFLLAERGQGALVWVLKPQVQLGFELMAWGGYVLLSGGATNPLISLLLPIVAIGALMLPKRHAWVLAVGAILLYSLLWFVYLPLQIDDVERAGQLHLFGMWLVFALSAVLVVAFTLQLSAGIRRRDQELAAAQEQAVRDDWLIALGGQAAHVAHDLGTPLGTLNLLTDELLEALRDDPVSLGLSQSALNGAPDDAPKTHAWSVETPVSRAMLREDLQAMKIQIHRCKEILGQLTQQAGQISEGEAASQWVDEWLAAWLADWRIKHSDLAVETQLQTEGLEGQCLAMDAALERALGQLLENAVKAGARRIEIVAQAAVPGSASVSDRQSGTGPETARLQLLLQDDGEGIDAAALEAFAQRRPPTSQSGLGVGLLLCRAAIERRGGRLDIARRNQSGGTQVRIQLPLHQASASLQRASSATIRGASEQAGGAE